MHPATILDDLASVIGYTATCALSAWYGGKTLYVPAKAGPDHPMSRLIGESALRALVREFGSEILKIPGDHVAIRMRRDRIACERFAEGWIPSRVADDLGIGLRRAQQLRIELEACGWLAYAVGRLPPAPATPTQAIVQA